MNGSRGGRGFAVAALSWLLVASLGGPAGGCKATGTKAGTTAGTRESASSPGRAADYFSCRRDSDCVVDRQKDCCPCNAGGAQIALRKGAVDDYAAARAARCGGDLLCPQVYLCDERAAAVCQAGRCALAKGSVSRR